MIRLFLSVLIGVFCTGVFATPNETGVLRVGSEPDYPPFCITDAEGNAAGFSVDLFRAAAGEMGYEVLFTVKPWSILKDELVRGEIDALPLVGRSPVREAVFDFTFPYHTLHGAVFVKNGQNTITSFDDLYTHRIATMKGDNAEEYLHRIGLDNNILSKETFTGAFEALSEGTADAVVAQRLMGLQLLKSIGMRDITPLDIPLDGFSQDFSFAVTEGDKELLAHLNEGLSIIIANGTYEKIHKKWFTPLLEAQLSFREKLRSMMALIIPIVMFLLIAFVVILRLQLYRQKKELYEAEEKYRILTEEIDAVLWEYDPARHEWIYISPKVASIIGYTPEEWRELNIWADRIHPDDKKAVFDRFANIAQSDKSLRLEYRLEQKDGTYIWLRDSVQQVRRRRGQILLSGYFVDITAEKTASIRLRQQLHEKEIILKDAYHRVKNSFSSIEAMLLLQSAETEDESVKSAFESVLSQIVSARTLYERLLYTGKESLEPAGYIAGLIDETATFYSHSYPGISFKTQLENIELMQTALFPVGIILNELITNLMKHSYNQDSRGEVQITAEKAVDAAVIVIKDDGKRFDPETKMSSRSGYGIDIVYMLIEQLGAELMVETIEEGTIRVLRIPSLG